MLKEVALSSTASVQQQRLLQPWQIVLIASSSSADANLLPGMHAEQLACVPLHAEHEHSCASALRLSAAELRLQLMHEKRLTQATVAERRISDVAATCTANAAYLGMIPQELADLTAANAHRAFS
eukprot:11680-Heterococcus_DN1.PRE.2